MLERRPLYEQVRQQVLEYIAGQDLQPGDIIPTEADLASRYGVSVGTVRRALRQLVDQEILYRQPGRGTFLTEHSRQRARQRGFLACIVPYIRNAFASNVIAGAQYAAQRADYGFLLYNSYGQPDLEEELLLQSLGSITGALINFTKQTWDWDLENPEIMLHRVREATHYPDVLSHVQEGVETFLVRLTRPDAPPVISERVTPDQVVFYYDYTGVFGPRG